MRRCPTSPATRSHTSNRAAAYVTRGEPGDHELALGDLARALEIEPEVAAAYLNRGIAYVARGSGRDLELAVADLSRAIDLSPASHTAYFNRGLVHSELGDWTESLSDLRRAHELRPHELAYNATLCWNLAVARLPEEALPYCDAAVAADPEGPARDGRGLANALLGRTGQAIADFEAFLLWVDSSPKDSCRAHYHPSRTAWIDALKAGDSPFGTAALQELRARPAPPGSGPC